MVPAHDPEREELEGRGWVVVARSFGAHLDSARIDPEHLRKLTADSGSITRELTADDVDTVLELDAATTGDYPGSAATHHEPLTRASASPSDFRRAFGAFLPNGDLVGMTFVDINDKDAETDFTVVHRDWRRRGLGTAVKAASILALAADGVTRFRTGGSAENTAILRSNDAVGYVRDEEWVTLRNGTERVSP